MRKLVSFFTLFIFFVSYCSQSFAASTIQRIDNLEQFKRQFPNAKFVPVDRKTLQEVIDRQNIQGQALTTDFPQLVQLAQTSTSDTSSPECKDTDLTHCGTLASESKVDSDSDSDNDPFEGIFDGGSCSGNGCQFVLIIFGVVIVAAMVFYVGKALVSLFSGDFEKLWSKLRFGRDTIHELNTEFTAGEMRYLNYSFGLASKDANIGLAMEAGRLQFDTPTRFDRPDGYYLIAGPSFRARSGTDREYASVYFEIMGGRSDVKRLDLISVARLGVDVLPTSYMSLGAHVTYLYTKIEDQSGLSDRLEEYDFLTGFTVGINF